MEYTRLSLLYSIAVLWISGLLLLIKPSLVFSFLNSSITYPLELTNVLGILFIVIGSFTTLIFKYKVEKIYKWTILIRIFFSLCSLGLYFVYQNSFFVTLLFIILIGVLITVFGLVKDQKI